MNVIKCGIKDCPSIFQTEEAVSPKARYACKLHGEAEQKVFFQEHAFDKDLARSGKPIGTSHIQRQGWTPFSNGETEIWAKIQEATKEKK
jgi:hypothetical protein